MLEPREADIPLLFFVLIVLPLVAYVWLGKWSEAAKRRERINMLAQRAAEEAFRAEAMSVAEPIPSVPITNNNGSHFGFRPEAISVANPVPPVPIANNNGSHFGFRPEAMPVTNPIPRMPITRNSGSHVCARCFSPASTRCSRCKSVRYCSGKCQIIHWRQVHKHECQQLETTGSHSPSISASAEDFFPENVSNNDGLNSSHLGHISKQAMMDNAPLDISAHSSVGAGVVEPANCSAADALQDTVLRRKSTDKRSRKSSKEMLRRQDATVHDSVGDPSRGRIDSHKYYRQQNIYDSVINCESSSSSHAGQNGTNSSEIRGNFVSIRGNSINVDSCVIGETSSYEATAAKVNLQVKSLLTPAEVDEMKDRIPMSGGNGVASIGISKIMGLRKPTKPAKKDVTGFHGINKKTRTLFPYDEFMKMFTCEVTNLSPGGLVNCGNSCYANAVLQCLMCTKPLTVFWLHRSHSRACCRKDWCLMCELERHVKALREYGSPLSPSRILSHMRNITSQIGDGSQEDAHEFLRILVASMQLICLDGLGGENKVDPVLQETTFIQYTFGGRLSSKVKCLRCRHVSERYESIMDLTLEIFGWVETLEDALTQFTTPEELDGDNMYRCGRCATYVHARKQLSIHEAPNILTIVLKRFQEGKYGKINKCIAFPDMLDMIPFMTGTGDIPPLYILYAVVVHLDTCNASFSGHYVAYVKDSQGSWLRIDDTEVNPVSPSQVMSEGAYMLFYRRSSPRPQGTSYKKSQRQEVPLSATHCTSQSHKHSKQGRSKSRSHFIGADPSPNIKSENGAGFSNHSNDVLRGTANRHIAKVMELSDGTSSEWSLFTSSDDASFTTDSTRDSFSTVDYGDAWNGDTFSSIFNNLYPPSSPRNTVCCRQFSNSMPQTRFVSEERGYVSEVGADMYHPISVNCGSDKRSSFDRIY